jgi:hypothetical protein
MNPDCARQIAEALGAWETWDEFFGKPRWVAGFKEGDSFTIYRFEGRKIINALDFSKPEWQIKIQEKVRELWVLNNSRWVETHDDFVGGKIKHQVVLKDGESTERVAYRTRYKESLAEVNTDALLWLAGQKAGKNYDTSRS